MVFDRFATGSFPRGSVGDARLAGPPSSQPQPTSGRPIPCLRSIRSLAHGSGCDLRSALGPGTSGAYASTTDLLSLPSLVIPGTSRTRRSTNETRGRCQDWLGGVRLELWDPPKPTLSPPSRDSATHESSFELDDRTAARVHTLALPSPVILLWLLRGKLWMSSDVCTLALQQHTKIPPTSSGLSVQAQSLPLTPTWCARRWLVSRKHRGWDQALSALRISGKLCVIPQAMTRSASSQRSLRRCCKAKFQRTSARGSAARHSWHFVNLTGPFVHGSRRIAP